MNVLSVTFQENVPTPRGGVSKTLHVDHGYELWINDQGTVFARFEGRVYRWDGHRVYAEAAPVKAAGKCDAPRSRRPLRQERAAPHGSRAVSAL